MMDRRFLSFILVGVFLLSACSALPGHGRTGNAFNVGQQTYRFYDKERGRNLTTEIWYPAADQHGTAQTVPSPFYRLSTQRDARFAPGRFPLILFSHGTGGGRLTVEWFCAALASEGFMVAAVDHHGNTFDNPIPEEFVKVWERPKDLSFVLTELLLTPGIRHAVDTARIGAAGFSLGGFSVMVMAGARMDFNALETYFTSEDGRREANIPEMPGLTAYLPTFRAAYKQVPSLQDSRIRSVFVMAPALGQAFPNKASFAAVRIPVMVTAAGGDTIAPLKTNAGYYARMIHNGRLKMVSRKAGHYVFLNEAKHDLKVSSPLYFVDPISVNRKEVHSKVVRLASAFFRETLQVY